MSNQPKPQDQQTPAQPQDRQQGPRSEATQPEQHGQQQGAPDFDGLKGKKPEELTPEELRWMADTMPGEGPGD